MPTIAPKNLFSGIPSKLPEEFCDLLCQTGQVRVERIVSQGQCSPEDFWYDQATNEFVLLVSGKATLDFADRNDPVIMEPGDWLEIKAHVRHRVSWTDPEQQTVWLAVHY